jgi:hypothetical protein
VAQRTADLVRANQNLEAFTYSVSHDLRSPLRALSGFSDALAEEYGDRLDETGRGYTARISAASERMSSLIDDLLHLSRISRAEIHLEAVDLSAEAASVADALQRRDPGRHASFAIQDAVWVQADRRLIRTVIENLLENAWKFTSHQPETCIDFGTMPTGDGAICCYVRDNGVGFDPAYKGKLFQPFERLHSTEDFPGTGIGLAKGTADRGTAGRPNVGRGRGRCGCHVLFHCETNEANARRSRIGSRRRPPASVAAAMASPSVPGLMIAVSSFIGCVSPGRCARPGLATSGHATACSGMAVSAAGMAVFTAVVTRRRMNAAPAPISDMPASKNAAIAAM